MSMSRFSRSQRTTALVGGAAAVFNTSGTWPSPYGRAVITVSGKGATGVAGSGGNPYSNSVYNPGGNPTPPTPVPGGNPTPPTMVPGGNPTPPTLVPGTATPPTNYVAVYQTTRSGPSMNPGPNSYYFSNVCPAPSSGYQYAINYSCTYGSNSNPPNADTYTANPPNATYYTANPPNVPYTTANPPNAASYYAGNSGVNTYVPPTKGADATFMGATFPGGYGGAASPANFIIYVPFSNTPTPVTVPTNASITITKS